MQTRTLGLMALLASLAFATTGCMQFGEYAMGGACEDLSEDVASVVRDAYGTEPEISGMWAGEADVWCRFTVNVGSDLAADDEARVSVRQAVEALMDEAGSDIEVTLTYANGSDHVAV